MGKVFFISDTHFGHKKIIEYENRPFNSIEEMDKTLMENWNNIVGENDEIYILGDLAFGNQEYIKNLLNHLNGKKYMIRGNHDRHIDVKDISNKFQWVKDYYLLNHPSGFKFVLFHYPIYSWAFQHHGSIHLYGHVHGASNDSEGFLNTVKNAFNVGVDVNKYEPIELNDILRRLDHKLAKRLETNVD